MQKVTDACEPKRSRAQLRGEKKKTETKLLKNQNKLKQQFTGFSWCYRDLGLRAASEVHTEAEQQC